MTLARPNGKRETILRADEAHIVNVSSLAGLVAWEDGPPRMGPGRGGHSWRACLMA